MVIPVSCASWGSWAEREYRRLRRVMARSGPVDWQALADLGIFVAGAPETVRKSLELQMPELGAENLLIWDRLAP